MRLTTVFALNLQRGVIESMCLHRSIAISSLRLAKIGHVLQVGLMRSAQVHCLIQSESLVLSEKLLLNLLMNRPGYQLFQNSALLLVLVSEPTLVRLQAKPCNEVICRLCGSLLYLL